MTSSMTLSGLEQALEDVGAVLRLLEPELGPAPDDLDLVVDVGLQRLHEVERARMPSTRATVLTAKFVCSGVCL